MAGGGMVDASGGKVFEAKITTAVIITCIMAAFGGLMFGYDIGITGGVTSMPDFLEKFFPAVYRKTESGVKESNYCKFDNQSLQLFTSSLYLAGLAATLFASTVTTKCGRRVAMIIAGILFIAGSLLNTVAENIIVLILGRVFLGFGVGFANQAVPVFLSEVSPARIRGALNILFQLNVTIGIVIANLINYFTLKIAGGWGWRLSLGLAGVPAVMLTVGAFLVDDSPTSLIARGYPDDGRRVLKRIRGIDNVEPEFEELVNACNVAKEIKNPVTDLLSRRNRPPLIIAIMMQIFQQLTGINAIMFYAPVLFDTLGFKNDASLYSSTITGVINVLSTLVSIYCVDKFGRRILLLEAGAQMCISQTIIGFMLAFNLQDKDDQSMPKLVAISVVVLVCTFVSSFGWSWGPLGWLIPSETFPLETRSIGGSVTVVFNMLFTFIVGQAFLSMLCVFKYGIFWFFSGWVAVMTLFTILLIPETKNVPIEEMADKVWKKHWFWKRYFDDQELNKL